MDPDRSERRQLPFCRDFLRDRDEPLWCDVVPMAPHLHLYWRYTQAQATDAIRWECPAVWVHNAAQDNGAALRQDMRHDLSQDLCVAVDRLVERKAGDAVRYSLLVSPDGMSYDGNRLGGDYHVSTPSGRHFTFSVRRDQGRRKLLLVVAWN